MRLSFTLPRAINNLFLTNGMIGAVYGKNVDFYNLLGGNAVLISCFGSNIVLTAVADNQNNLLITYDSANNLVFYYLKLSISRVSTNECYPIYRIKRFIPSSSFGMNRNNNLNEADAGAEAINKKKYYSSVNDSGLLESQQISYFANVKKNVKIEIFKNFLFLMQGNEYLLVLDLNFSRKNAEIENVVYYREFLINVKLSSNKLKYAERSSVSGYNRNAYISEYNNEALFKINIVNKFEIFLLLQISDFDLFLANFSAEDFSSKNVLLTKDYFHHSNINNITNFIDFKRFSHINASTFKNLFADDFVDLNVFNLDVDKLNKSDYFAFDEYYDSSYGSNQDNNSINNKYKNAKSHKNRYSSEYSDSSSDNPLKNNLYYRIFYTNIDSVLLYGVVIIIAIIFTFFLRIFYNKKKAEREALMQKKVEEAQSKNLSEIKAKADLFKTEETLLNNSNGSNNNNITKDSKNIKTEEINKLINVIKNPNNTTANFNLNNKTIIPNQSTKENQNNSINPNVADSNPKRANAKLFSSKEEAKLKNYILNNKKFSSSEEENYEDFNSCNKISNADLHKTKTRIQDFINREKNNLKKPTSQSAARNKLENEIYLSP